MRFQQLANRTNRVIIFQQKKVQSLDVELWAFETRRERARLETRDEKYQAETGVLVVYR